jgi:hypothetical protein
MREKKFAGIVRDFVQDLGQVYPSIAHVCEVEVVVTGEKKCNFDKEMDQFLYHAMIKLRLECSELPPKWYADDMVFSKWETAENKMTNSEGLYELVWDIRELFGTGYALPKSMPWFLSLLLHSRFFSSKRFAGILACLIDDLSRGQIVKSSMGQDLRMPCWKIAVQLFRDNDEYEIIIHSLGTMFELSIYDPELVFALMNELDLRKLDKILSTGTVTVKLQVILILTKIAEVEPKIISAESNRFFAAIDFLTSDSIEPNIRCCILSALSGIPRTDIPPLRSELTIADVGYIVEELLEKGSGYTELVRMISGNFCDMLSKLA